MTLNIINGGKSGGTGGGGGGGGGTGAAGGDPFEWHPLAEALYDAIYPRDARTFEDVRQRMSRIERRRISNEEVGRTLRHVRDYEFEYGWTVPPVQKGNGKFRRYFPVHVKSKDVDSTISAKHLECIDYGLISAVKTIATQIGHVLGAVEMISETANMSRGHRRQYRAMASQLAGADAIAQQLVRDTAV
jgi:hypothetical protein